MYTETKKTCLALLAKIAVENPEIMETVKGLLEEIPEQGREEVIGEILQVCPDVDLGSLYKPTGNHNHGDLLSADDILTTEWPEPIWAVPDILPVGLGILAGAPKLGKSWFALQVSKAVALGGKVFGKDVECGSILYLALEDPPRRLQERMLKQKWPSGLKADFMPVGSFQDKIGDLRNGGGEILSQMITEREYRMVTIDTLSRSVTGDQNDVKEMTSWLTPLQETAHKHNCAIVLVDHHRKSSGNSPDVIGDILGSTGKSAMADTVLGLYRERGKTGAKLSITGREVEEKTLALSMDWEIGCWELDLSGVGVTDQQSDILSTLEEVGPTGVQELAEALDMNKGTLYHQLAALEKRGLATKDRKTKEWSCVS